MNDRIKYSVLVVDDNPTNLKLVANVLNSHYKLFIADNGEKAIQIALSKSPDLILLDVMMPGLSGYEVCHVLKQNDKTKEIPIIFLTAKTDENDIEMAFDAGGSDYISKPFKTKEVLARIRTQLELQGAKRKLEKQNEELKELIANRDKFFSIIANDLRSPFSGFLNMTELMANGLAEFSQDTLNEIGREIHVSAVNIFKLIENLLDWARMQRGHIIFEPTENDLYKIVDDTIQSLMPRANHKQIQLINAVPQNCILKFDEKMIFSVFRNLLSNGVKFSYKGGMVSVSLDTSNEKEIIIIVSDNGKGISKSDIEKIFKIEGNVKSKGTDGEPSTGLGLLLCKEFVEKHNGRIWVESELNRGSKFFFSIPR